MIRNSRSDPKLRALCFHVCVDTDCAESRVFPGTYNDIGAESRSLPSPCRHGLNASWCTTLCGSRELSLRHFHDRKRRAAAEDNVMTRIPPATKLPTQTNTRKGRFGPQPAAAAAANLPSASSPLADRPPPHSLLRKQRPAPGSACPSFPTQMATREQETRCVSTPRRAKTVLLRDALSFGSRHHLQRRTRQTHRENPATSAPFSILGILGVKRGAR